MRKLFVLVAFVLATICLLASCNSHAHSFGEWEIIKEATCAEEGERARYCSCGEKQSEVIYAKGHSKIITEATEPTCTEKGHTEGEKCSVCGVVLIDGEEIPAKGHNYDGAKCTVCGEYNPTYGSHGLEYSLSDDGSSYSVSMGICTDTDIIIPSIYNGLPVSSIGDSAFYQCDSLTSIVIPDSVTNISYWAFADCDSLTNISVSDKNQSYKSIDGNLYTKDGETLIQYAVGKEDSTFIILDGVTIIGDGAFVNCSSLTSIVIPSSVTSIGSFAFYNCSSLTSIYIPNSVTSIDDRAFHYCETLTNISVSDKNQSYKSIDGNLYTKDGETLIQYALGKADPKFIVPDGVTRIGGYAFSGCKSLASVVIPDSVTSIDGAFYECSSLTSIVIPDSVTSIDGYAFFYCISLASIVIPDSVTNIGCWAFNGCSSLTDVHYTGTEEEWLQIEISSDNTSILSAAIHYNYVPQN